MAARALLSSLPRTWVAVSALLAGSLLGMQGCGGGADPSSTPVSAVGTPGPSADAEADTAPSLAASRQSIPVAAISSAIEPGRDDLPEATTGKNSPDGILREIARIRSELTSAQDNSPPSEQRRSQLERIIELARRVIAATHQLPGQEQQFNNAVHYLSDTRLELAKAGDPRQSQLLIEDAESLYRRDKQSSAAVESASKVVQLAQDMAERKGQENPGWFSEFANQARVFAEKFPHEPNRSALFLMTAGRLCDLEGKADDARDCFAMVHSQFPDTIFDEQVSGFLRRLSLVGRPLELTGPTLNGEHVSIDDYQGQFVLVVFWASTSPQFQLDCGRLIEVLAEYEPRGLSLIGVNLDEDEAEVVRFLDEHSLPGPHVFYAEPEKRAGRNPIARYYGVQRLSTYWLVDRTGIVVATPADLDGLVHDLPNLIAAP